MKIVFFIDGFAANGEESRLTELMKSLNIKQDINFELVVVNIVVNEQKNLFE